MFARTRTLHTRLLTRGHRLGAALHAVDVRVPRGIDQSCVDGHCTSHAWACALNGGQWDRGGWCAVMRCEAREEAHRSDSSSNASKELVTLAPAG